jgi:uncharacterized protein YkwD
MKKLITTLLLSILVFMSYSQTPLDYRIFKTLNEYRATKGLEPWVWSQELFPVPLHHSNYMVLVNDIGHKQDTDVPNFTEYYTLVDRLYNSVVTWVKGGENVAVINCDGLTSNTAMSKKVLRMWINSPPHHELLLSTEYKYGSVSARYSTTWVGYENSDFWNYITLNVYR